MFYVYGVAENFILSLSLYELRLSMYGFRLCLYGLSLSLQLFRRCVMLFAGVNQMMNFTSLNS